LFECFARNRDSKFLCAVWQDQDRLACIEFIPSILFLLVDGIQRSKTRLGWIPVVISVAHRQSVGIGSGGLPIWLWDPGIQLVGRLLHFFIDKVVTTMSLLHSTLLDGHERDC